MMKKFITVNNLQIACCIKNPGKEERSKKKKFLLNNNTSVFIDINNLPEGTYNLLLKGISINEHIKFGKVMKKYKL
jgi:hypothetical protein